MNKRLNRLVEQLQAGGDQSPIGVLSTGERCYVVMAANRYDLLPTCYADPIEAWNRLEPAWRQGVCEWRGWPKSYAGGAR